MLKKKKPTTKPTPTPLLKAALHWLPNPLPPSLSKQGPCHTLGANSSASRCPPKGKTLLKALLAAGEVCAHPPQPSPITSPWPWPAERQWQPRFPTPGTGFCRAAGSWAELQHSSSCPHQHSWEQPHSSEHSDSHPRVLKHLINALQKNIFAHAYTIKEAQDSLWLHLPGPVIVN